MREANRLIPAELITLGDHLRKARIDRGHYQSDLAKTFKTTTDTVTNWELNRNKIQRLHYPIIKKYLGYLPKEYELTKLAEKLVAYRFEYDLSMRELAKQIGVDYSCIQSVERGKENFQKVTREKFQRFINYKIGGGQLS